MPTGKPCSGDVEDVPAAALEPRRHAPEVVVLLEDATLRPAFASTFAPVSPASPLPITSTS
jgi:hypothetical protein